MSLPEHPFRFIYTLVRITVAVGNSLASILVRLIRKILQASYLMVSASYSVTFIQGIVGVHFSTLAIDWQQTVQFITNPTSTATCFNMGASAFVHKLDSDTYMTNNIFLRQWPSDTSAFDWIIDRFFIRRRKHGEYIDAEIEDEETMASWIDQTDRLVYTLSRTKVRAQPRRIRREGYPDTTPALTFIPESNPRRARSMMPMLHSLIDGDDGVIWAVGNDAFLKISLAVKGITPEHETLQWINSKDPRPSFYTPKVIYFMRGYDDRKESPTYRKLYNFVFLTRVPGRTLDVAWPSLSQKDKDMYVDVVAEKISEMARWKGTRIGGIRAGEGVMENLLMPRDGDGDYSKVADTCRALGMDWERTVFYHCDLNPTNIMVEMKPSKKIGIIDFEAAGFVPCEWVRTRFAASKLMSWGMDTEDGRKWQKHVHRRLGELGFTHCNAWKAWSEQNHDEVWTDMSPVNSWSSVHHGAPIVGRHQQVRDVPEAHGQVVTILEPDEPPPAQHLSPAQTQFQTFSSKQPQVHTARTRRRRTQLKVERAGNPSRKRCIIL